MLRDKFIQTTQELQFMRVSDVFFSILFLTFSTNALSKNDYSGFWWSETRSSIFELVQTEQTIIGITRWGKEPRPDIYNPDIALRQRSLLNVTFLWGFKYKSKDNSWHKGKVYDPASGKTYSAKLKLSNNGNILKMRGYVGISLFGRNARFERVKTEEIPANLVSSSGQ